jgi:hypothetical protein
MLGAKDTFFYKLVGPLVDVMGSAGEELKRQQAMVEQVLKTEEEQLRVLWSVVWRCWMKNWQTVWRYAGRRNRIPSV